MSAQNKDVKSILLAGIIAAGVFAGAFGSIQLLSASAQTVEPEEEQTVNGPSTVSTSGTASMHVQPDKFTVTVGVQTDGATAQEAASQNADLMDAVIAALEALGVEESQMSTSQYSVYPQYSYKDMVNACRVMEEYPIPPECYVEQEITSYRASSSISVTLDVAGDIEAGQVIDTAVEAGANTVDGAYFFLSSERQQEVQEGLIEEAIASARHRADIAAGAVGMHVSGVQSLSLSDVFFSPYYVRDISTSAIVPGEQPVSMTVQAVYTLGDGEAEGSESAMEIARAFILSKLPGLGIEIEDELDLHTDLIPFVSENELHVDYSVVDTDGDVHDGHIEVVDGEVTVASLDGESIL